MYSWSHSCLLPIYLIGCFANVFPLWMYCVQKENWKKQDNIKYLTVVQALSSVIVISCNFFLLLLDFLPPFVCDILPTLMVFNITFAMLNLTTFAIVKYAQLSSKWRLRFRTVLMILWVELAVALAVDFPVIYSTVKKSSLVEYHGSPCCNYTALQPTPSPEIMKLDVVAYAASYVFFHVVFLGTILINRSTMITLYLWFLEKDNLEAKTYRIVKGITNGSSVILVTVVLFLAPFLLENNEETLDFLNYLFDVSRSFAVALFCFPIYLWDEAISKMGSSDTKYDTFCFQKLSPQESDNEKVLPIA